MESDKQNEINNSESLQSLLAEQNDLLRRNLKVSEEILQKTDSIKIYIKWQKIWSTVRLLIIVIPLIVGLLFLPPLLKNYLNQFSSLYQQ